jgi:hypothetical protein
MFSNLKQAAQSSKKLCSQAEPSGYREARSGAEQARKRYLISLQTSRA